MDNCFLVLFFLIMYFYIVLNDIVGKIFKFFVNLFIGKFFLSFLVLIFFMSFRFVLVLVKWILLLGFFIFEFRLLVI